MDAFKTFTYTTKITMLLLFVVFAGGIGANADDSLNKFDDPSEKRGLFRFVWNISLQPFSVMASGTGLLADA